MRNSTMQGKSRFRSAVRSSTALASIHAGTQNRKSYYKSATRDKKRGGWYAPSTSPDTALNADLEMLRNRSQAGQRNSNFLKSGINNLVAYEVGTGIVPRAVSDDEDFNVALDTWFEEWADYCDASEVLNFYGNQALAARCRRVSGEVFIRLRTVKTAEVGQHPLRIEIIEPDFCPISLTQLAPNGNQIKQGVEFNRKGKRVAYWMFKQHPSDIAVQMQFQGSTYVRIAAKHIIHHFMPLRPQQVRGEPDSAQPMLKTFTLEQYEQAELERKETRAPFTGFINRDFSSEEEFNFDPFTGELLGENSTGAIGMDLEAGTIVQGLPGESLTLFDGEKGNEAYAEYVRQQALQIAAGLGLPYPLMTGDYKDVNDRTIRADLNNFYRQIDMIANHIMVYQTCRRIRNRFIELAIISGKLNAPSYVDHVKNYQKTEWMGQPRAYIHPVQDIDAAVKAIENNLDSEPDYLRSRGKNPDNIIKRRAEFQEKVQKEMPKPMFELVDDPKDDSGENE